jgi:hypothetical protein
MAAIALADCRIKMAGIDPGDPIRTAVEVADWDKLGWRVKPRTCIS